MTIRKSQTSTEYIILLAIVIVIALVAINTLGGFPGIGANNNKKVSDFKLSSDTIGIESYSIGSASSLFKIKNNYFDTITVTEFRVNQQSNLTCNSSNTIPALPVVLNVGQSMIINCSVVNSSSYTITTKQTPVVGISYIDPVGATRTAGNTQSSSPIVVQVFECTALQTNCSGTNYINCSNGYWVNNGNVSGLCNYTAPGNVTSLRNSLVGYWPLDANINDNSTGGHNGVWAGSGSHTFSTGAVGNAANFTASNSQKISIGNLGTMNDATISFWIKPAIVRTAGDNWPNPYSNTPSGDHRIRGDYVFSNSVYNLWSHGFCAPTYQGNLTVPKDQWTHVLLKYSVSSDISREYHNGVLVLASAISCYYVLVDNTFHNDFPDVSLGQGYGSSRYWDGMIDEAAIWNRTLNDSEITQLYNSGNGLSLVQ